MPSPAESREPDGSFLAQAAPVTAPDDAVLATDLAWNRHILVDAVDYGLGQSSAGGRVAGGQDQTAVIQDQAVRRIHRLGSLAAGNGRRTEELAVRSIAEIGDTMSWFGAADD